MLDQLPSLLSAVVSDGFSFEQFQSGSVAGFAVSAVLSRLMHRRLEAAQSIFLEELRAGETSLPPAQIDDGVAIVYRYFRAAQEGAARINLRLMAKVIAGQARLSNLSADEFLSDADVIAALRRDEIILLATVHRGWTSDRIVQEPEDSRVTAPLRWAEAELVPSVFRDAEDLRATAASIVRTGLLVPLPSWDWTRYAPTPKLARLVSLASFEAALNQEGAV